MEIAPHRRYIGQGADYIRAIKRPGPSEEGGELMNSRSVVLAACAGFLALNLAQSVSAADIDDLSRWNAIRADLYGDRPISDAAGVFELDAPKRPEMAASVPVTIRALVPQTKDQYISKLTLIVDENPVPVVATFLVSPTNGTASIATKVRVNDFSHIHVVGEMSDGRLLVADKYVKSMGGCSADPLSNQEAARARLGRMTLDQPDPVNLGTPSTFKFTLGHPNNSGLQFDQLTRNYIPAHYITSAEITFDGAPVLTVIPNISVAEDPTFTFSYVVEKPGEMKVHIEDSKHNVFIQSYRVVPGAGS